MLHNETDDSMSTSIPLLAAISGAGGIQKADIVKRLEQLNKWQEEQKQLLALRQNVQRQMLGMEQKTMYQMLGLHGGGDDEEEGDASSEVDESRQEYEEGGEHPDDDGENENHSYSTRDQLTTQHSMEPSSYKTLTSGYGTEEYIDIPQQAVQKPKRPFLKRGEGLKQRFKIDPEELRITNLPRYKYANAHPKLKAKTNKKATTKAVQKPKVQDVRPPSPPLNVLDANEKRFQQLLISSKNVCNSTPDTKSSLMSSKNISSSSSSTSTNSSHSLPKVRFVETTPPVNNNSNGMVHKYPNNEVARPAPPSALAWSKILDSQQIKPLPILRTNSCDRQNLPQSEEDIFELLEQKAKNGSFDMDSTCMRQFMQRRTTETKFNDTDVIPVNDQLRTRRLQPIVIGGGGGQNNRDESTSSLEEENDENSTIIPNSTEAGEESTQKTLESTNSQFVTPNSRASENRVRFSECHDTREFHEEQTVSDFSNFTNANETPGDLSNNVFFEQFKKALFAALQDKAEQHETSNSMMESEGGGGGDETTLTSKDSFMESNTSLPLPPNSLELQEKTQLIKTRLEELEKEIALFKQNNAQLMKAKQEHELLISQHAQEQLEATERLNDERIQMEIYLHDERMKLEEDKRKFEQSCKMKTQAMASKERKEMEKLREQVAQLEAQLKTKDSNHAAAQARWRTQIRTMEREEKRLHEQIELLTKENKRLENEMLKASRENNNKLLQEINRNIAKLAPKQTQHASISFPSDDQPPVLASSKNTTKPGTTNKNSKSPSKKTKRITKTNTTTSTASNRTIMKQEQHSFPDTPSSDENYTELGFQKSVTKPKSPHTSAYSGYPEVGEDEDDDDILQELQANNNRTPITTNKVSPASSSQMKESKSTANNENKSPDDDNLKREILNADGSKDIWYPNGNLKKISADGMLIRMLYYNKDIKETNINEGTVKYYYHETNTWHTTYLDGLEILEFPNGQIEHRHKTGLVEVHYPNNSVKIIDPRDEKKAEEWRFPDGTHLVQMRNGDKILSLPNGQKEIHTKLQKRREYPDGTVKIVYPDGSTETRYSNGRVRLKDKEGNLVMDTEETK
ncbi:centromere protein J [Musca vetustissima]|uniref:centromere protein J n=1 Tax=Musca vetustissima TaxID=27455 RepID=UPI002AB6C587|nr:centromere protein J [Musca vetustissima]